MEDQKNKAITITDQRMQLGNQADGVVDLLQKPVSSKEKKAVIITERDLVKDGEKNQTDGGVNPDKLQKTENLGGTPEVQVKRLKDKNGIPLEISEELGTVIKTRSASRANQDVAAALVMTEEIQYQMAERELTYVVHGAKMICSMGSREGRLVVPVDHGTCIKGRPQITKEDCVPGDNIQCFGNCMSTYNPNMKQAASEGVEDYREKNKSIVDRVKEFFGVKPKEIDPSQEMMELCMCECEPRFSGSMKWLLTNDDSQLNGVSVTSSQGRLVCMNGGTITITDDGQEE